MATIVDINFTGVTITEPGDGHNTGTLSGTLQVNYTTGIVTLASGTTDLHFSGPPGHSYTTFVLAHVGDVFTLTSGTGLTLTWTGQQPSALTVGTGLNVVILPGHIYSTLSAATNHLISTIPCFAAGTLIRTPRGDAPVESLQVGDLVVTASGEPRPVKWIGHSDFDLRSHPNPRPVFPVRIAADALGPGRPSQDLYVSSGHFDLH